MKSSAKTVQEYLNQLPEDRRKSIEAVRAVILKNLPKGYVEEIGYGMIAYVVPHSLYPKGYHCNPKLPLPFANLASQKNHMALYLFCIYGSPTLKSEFLKEYEASGKKMDVGGSCIRFRKAEDLPLDLIGKTIRSLTVKKYVEGYEAALADSKLQRTSKTSSKKAATGPKKPTPNRTSNKKG